MSEVEGFWLRSTCANHDVIASFFSPSFSSFLPHSRCSCDNVQVWGFVWTPRVLPCVDIVFSQQDDQLDSFLSDLDYLINILPSTSSFVVVVVPALRY